MSSQKIPQLPGGFASSRSTKQKEPKKSFRPVVAQSKSVALQLQVKSPTAPPVYRLSPPKVLQKKTLAGLPSSKRELPHSPIGPPVYRPQLVPKVLQTKDAGIRQPLIDGSARRPIAPPVYRPQAKKIVQPKMVALAQPSQVKRRSNQLIQLAKGKDEKSPIKMDKTMAHHLNSLSFEPSGADDDQYSQMAMILKGTKHEGKAAMAVEFYKDRPPQKRVIEKVLDISNKYNVQKA